jgi:uncharacterized protein (DUF1330 family)
MAAYFIVEIDITDPVGFEDCRKRVPATIERYGGRYLVRGGTLETIEGGWTPKRVVVLEFPSIDQARRWYHSEEYRELKALRLRTSRGNIVLVEGAA